MARVFVVPDTHFPFHDKKALKKVLQLIKKEKPTHVVQIGDLLDQYSFSKYSKSVGITPKDDVIKGLKAAKQFWTDVKKAAPKAKCLQLLGNHDIRMKKRIADNLPELEAFFDPNDLYRFKGVFLASSDRDYIDIDGVRYLHGYLSKSIDHALKQNRSVVHGHRHRPELSTYGPALWSMDVGFLGNEKELPFQYTQSKTTNWRLACGLVENGLPRLILL